MLVAGDEDAGDMQRDQAEGDIDEPFVQVLHPLRPPEGVRGHHEPGRGYGGDHPQKGEGHQATGRVVAEITRGTPANRLAHVAEGLRRRPHAEARMAGADEAPGNAQRDEGGDGVAHGNMQPLELVACREGNEEQEDEAPVEDAHEQIPYPDHRRASGCSLGGRRRRHHAAGLDRFRLSGHALHLGHDVARGRIDK